MMHLRELFTSLSLVAMASLLSAAAVADAAEPSRAEAATPETRASETGASETAKAAAKTPASKPVATGSQSELGMSVTGTQEAPKVLYIVPWKTLDAVPAEPYVSGLLDEVFSPVDPVVFERSVRHHEQIQGAATAAEPQP